VEVLPIPASLVPENLYLLGDQRKEGRNANETACYSHRLLDAQEEYPFSNSPLWFREIFFVMLKAVGRRSGHSSA
jgi:hypothetical protein